MTHPKGLEGDDLIKNIQQLVSSFEPHISELESTDQVKDVLLQLERNDEHFHKREIVKQLKSGLNDVIDKNSMTGQVVSSGYDVDRSVKQRTDAIRSSKDYKDFKKKLHDDVKDAVEHIVLNYDSLKIEDQVRGSGLPQQRQGFMGSDDEDISSCGSIFCQGSVTMFDPDALKKIANELSISKSHQTKYDAMLKLNRIMSADMVNNNSWNYLRKQLLDVLSDPDEELTQLSQKFIAKAFTNTCHQTREIYSLLTEYLTCQFQTRDSNRQLLSNGLDTSKPENIKLLKAFRLMNEFQQEASNYWIRYPDKYLEEVVESTLKLFSVQQTLSTGVQTYLMPLHYLALVDPKAVWCIKWMHGNYSRRALLSLLKDYKQIVENAVYHCLHFFNKKTKDYKSNDIAESLSKLHVSSGTTKRKHFYTSLELEYIYLIHSLCFIGRLLCFIDGRKFFPMKFKVKSDYANPVTVTTLLKAFITIIVECPSVWDSKSESLDAASLMSEVLKDLCECGKLKEIGFCHNDITTALLIPISQYLNINTGKKLPSEEALLHVADILCVMASDSDGRQHLMYGEGGNMFSKAKTLPPIHYICEFTKKCLRKELPAGISVPSRTVIGVYLYICRQLYITCDGLHILLPYNLHTYIADAWLEASQAGDRAATPTQLDSQDTISRADDDNVLFWQDSLLGSLLNFASTARGILLLQQNKAINECVAYMYDRYKRKLQVGKFEKFGYGVMVTQVAATAPGISALQNTGYIQALMNEIWTCLECGESDVPVYAAKVWPVDVIERSSHKHLIRILNILSSFAAVYELLATKPLPVKDSYTFREIPDTIAAMLDRLIMVDSPAKIHSLFNYEHSHVFGLRALSVMVSCLDTSLLLQSQYKIQDVFLMAQAEDKTDSDQFIIDMLSAERNYILVSSFLIGGPSERILPPHSLEQGETQKPGVIYPYPMFSSYPVPKEYIPNLAGRSVMKQDNEMTKFLSASGRGDKKMAWLDKCRSLFFNLLTKKPDQVKGTLLQLLFEQTVQAMSQIKEEAVYPLTTFTGGENSIKSYNLSPLQLLGVKVAVRYGIHLKVVTTPTEATDSLTRLLKQTGAFFQQKSKHSKTSSTLLYQKGSYPGFDWFASTIFLMFNGDGDKAWRFLHKFSTLTVSGYLWMPRLHSSEDLPDSIMYTGIPPIFYSTAHNMEFVLQSELPTLASAFKMSGFTPAQICVHWLKQCFWNYFDWSDICQYLVLCIIMGVDYQVYICVAILKHLEKDILQHMQTHDLIIFLKENPIKKFRVAENLKYMKTLETKFRKIVLKDMVTMVTRKK
ncbi:protein broad-minded isoform X2 [Patella vulgata]|uniref:protein broad-minded isoform X2 n=1 Tax=Patella vulgata TaxID=6465 RepID=UPI00217F5E71|nr:protein broad-minded isoform X2 [Patella vulgata]